MNLEGKKILLAVTGSISAYKAAFLTRLLVKAGCEVRVITTDAAREFVSDLTFSNLSKNEVLNDLWGGEWTEHIHLANWCDLLLVAPATAHTLSKMAHGLCDNFLTAVYLSYCGPVVVAPAMDADMFRHPATAENIQKLKDRSVHIVPSPEGEHASGLMGPGRFAEPEQIIQFISSLFGPLPLSGKRIMISAGPTQEAIDPVRFISNHSTGTMGFALASVAQSLGATVTLIKGPTSAKPPDGAEIVDFRSAQDLYEACMKYAPEMDIIIMTAAVADFTPSTRSDIKIKKGKTEGLQLDLIRTKDVLKNLGIHKPEGQILVGFALETNNEVANAKRKLENKNLDLIVLNSLKDDGAGFGTDSNKICILDREGDQQDFDLKSKQEVAQDIMSFIVRKISNEK